MSATAMAGAAPRETPSRGLPDPLYYLRNFETVLTELEHRDAGVLDSEDQAFIDAFRGLAEATRALLVRLIMRRHALIRRDTLVYGEIGPIEYAAAPLIGLGWIVENPPLTLDEIVRLFSKPELCRVLRLPRAWLRRSKALLRSALAEHRAEEAIASCAPLTAGIWQLSVKPRCDLIRALYFGNFRQEWQEFVLTDLKIRRFESVTAAGRPFDSPEQVRAFKALRTCQLMIEEGAAARIIESSLPPPVEGCEWLEERRQDCLLALARLAERQKDAQSARRLLAMCRRKEARAREQKLLAAISSAPRAARKPRAESRFGSLSIVEVPILHEFRGRGIEHPVRRSLLEEAPDSEVHYVENSLITALFGLLCWQAIFAPLRGAFFHRFHRAPADLSSPSFYTRRRELFEACLEQLDSAEYRRTILANYHLKHGVSSAFVSWRALDDRLIERALECIAPPHLALWFRYILQDVRENCAGFPDLIQFWPRTRTYRLLEVKGPRDRLQPSQSRCLEYLHANRLPVFLCRPRFGGATARSQPCATLPCGATPDP